MQQQDELNSWKIIYKGFSPGSQEQHFCARLWQQQSARLLWVQTIYCCFGLIFFVQLGVAEIWWQALNWQAIACLGLWLFTQAMMTWFGLQIESAKAGRLFLNSILTQHFVMVALLMVLLPQWYDVVMSSWFVYSLPVLLCVIYLPIFSVIFWLLISATTACYLAYGSSDHQQFMAVLSSNLSYVALLLVAQSLLHLVWRHAYAQHLVADQQDQSTLHNTPSGEQAMYVDSLTGFANYARFKQFSETEIERSSRYQNAYSIVLINVNHFSNYHDKLGDDDADKLLTSLANFLQSQIRKIDLLARTQADQFVIGLPESGLYQALDTAERIKETLDNEFWLTFPEDLDLGSRLGVACVDNTVTDIEQLLAKAENAMNNHRSAIALSYGR
ncbi:GGDEF domain-containing protein [Agarivorans sp. TSD2052]|uniref:GGDEF domain-containing protein n=1 Tax=Agarivorans sp. TSD2052 TaxID=2937286 RepID=UPI00200E1625|nr:GGDEF domain-containing protein [Agarivorans sp. TSD2052]UPW20246.1 GGDEF domain-containing protein [Agarivorans sp. TSD2052]